MIPSSIPCHLHMHTTPVNLFASLTPPLDFSFAEHAQPPSPCPPHRRSEEASREDASHAATSPTAFLDHATTARATAATLGELIAATVRAREVLDMVPREREREEEESARDVDPRINGPR